MDQMFKPRNIRLRSEAAAGHSRNTLTIRCAMKNFTRHDLPKSAKAVQNVPNRFQLRLNAKAQRREDAIPYPNGVTAVSPRVGESESLPWVNESESHNPEVGCGSFTSIRVTLFLIKKSKGVTACFSVSQCVLTCWQNARGRAQSKTWRSFLHSMIRDSVLDCASPLALFSGHSDPIPAKPALPPSFMAEKAILEPTMLFSKRGVKSQKRMIYQQMRCSDGFLREFHEFSLILDC